LLLFCGDDVRAVADRRLRDAIRNAAASLCLMNGVCCLQPAYADADSTATALSAVAPVGVKLFRLERCNLAAVAPH
jgi:hypothetical protein